VWDAVRLVEARMEGNGRLLVRASGTEQLVRVMAEANDEETARAAVDEIAQIVSEKLG